jgi:hypothetical protein
MYRKINPAFENCRLAFKSTNRYVMASGILYDMIKAVSRVWMNL